jgi:hypothetical protein
LSAGNFFDSAHRIRICLFANSLIARGIGDVPFSQSVNEAPLHVAAAALALLGFGEVRVGLLQAIGGRSVVDVRTERERHAPMRHRRCSILRGGELERLERLFVIEAVQKRQAFIEKLLRIRVRGLDHTVIRTEVAEQRRPRRLPGRCRAPVGIVRGLIGRRRRRGLTRASDDNAE